MKTILNLYRDTDYISTIKPKLAHLGIKKLTQSILMLAIKDIENKNEYCDDAVRWIFSNDTNYVFSFLNICQVFDLNPEQVRKAIKLNLPENYQTILPTLSFKQIIKGYGRCLN